MKSSPYCGLDVEETRLSKKSLYAYPPSKINSMITLAYSLFAYLGLYMFCPPLSGLEL